MLRLGNSSAQIAEMKYVLKIWGRSIVGQGKAKTRKYHDKNQLGIWIKCSVRSQ